MTKLYLSVADELGVLRAEIAELQAREHDLKAAVVAAGERVEGELFDALPVFSEKDQIDWKSVAQKLNPSRQLVQAHTKHSVSVSVRVTAKPQRAKEVA